MDTLSYKTVSANKATVNKEWVVVDARDQVVGRLSTKVAKLLRGKYKPSYTPHVDCGDNVIVINADKVRFTGKKWTDKEYFSHSGYPGGFSIATPKSLYAKNPVLLIENAVRGMLPKNKLGAALFRNLHVNVGETDKYEAQKPKVIDLNNLK
ncbi:MAG: 50S ribosomal protein L13 [Bacteroidota bacterium]|nr:50S ribosomal protein L13 [Bacteroidota bacterium]MDP4226320.1 50S ribosomal protein L13 [Bacteroidota bacterium]MDP4275885.1 50S ribosomal protein L13 [Bacteroidota bacterium]